MKSINTFFAAAAVCVAGAFSVSASAATDGWRSIGMGTYTEDIIGAFVPNYTPQTYEVEIEQNIYDPNVYRAINVYKNWKSPSSDKFAYDATKATPIVWHVIYGKYAYIDNFNTGVVYTNGEVSEPIVVNTAVSSFIGEFGLDYTYSHVPDAFASFRFGELTQDSHNSLSENFYARWNGKNYTGNSHGSFKVTLPENPIEVESDWKAIGTGSYTDDIMASANSVHFSVSTFDVEVEQNVADPTFYRLVNPYKNIAISEDASEFISYDSHARYYMEFHVYSDGTGYIEDFNTGVHVNDLYPYKVTSAAAALVKEKGLAAAKAACPGAFGKYNTATRTLTFPYQFTYQGAEQYCLDIDCELGYFDGANEHSAFSLTIPDGSNVPGQSQTTEETWTLLSEDEVMFNAITSDLVSGSTAAAVKVAVEQSDLKRNRFRVVNPFKNWTPAGSLKVDASKPYYLPFYVDAEAGTGYIDSFETGLVDGSNAISIVSASATDPATAHGTYNAATRTLSIPATFTIGGKQVASMSVGEKAVNTTGRFTITVPKDAFQSSDKPQEPTANWSSLGKGKYTDDIFASVLGNINVSTFEVDVEQDLNATGHYRIVDPYKNWKNPMPDYILADAENPGVIEFREEDGHVWFTTINTGFTFGGSPLKVEHLAGAMIANGERSLQEIIASYPDALAVDKNGLITQKATFEYADETFPTVTIAFDDASYDGNVSGKMQIEMPGYEDNKPGPDDEWWPYGIGQYTDDLLPEMFYEGVEPSTFDVVVEKNLWTPGVYRIVDPYKYWVNTYSDNIQKYTGEYMVIHAEDPSYVWIENFYLGLKNVSPTAEFRYYASNQIADMLKEGYTITKIKKWYPTACAKMENNVITYESGFEDSGSWYPNWRMSFGEDDQRPTVANKNGLFRIDLNVRSDYNSIPDVNVVNETAPVEYFDLQGRRVANPSAGVYIRRCGSKVSKVLLP